MLRYRETHAEPTLDYTQIIEPVIVSFDSDSHVEILMQTRFISLLAGSLTAGSLIAFAASVAAMFSMPCRAQSVGGSAECFTADFQWIPCKILEIDHGHKNPYDENDIQPYHIEYTGSNSWAGRKQWVDRIRLRPSGTPGKAPPPSALYGGTPGKPIPFPGENAAPSGTGQQTNAGAPVSHTTPSTAGAPAAHTTATLTTAAGAPSNRTGLVPTDSGLPAGFRPKSATKPTKASQLYGMFPQNVVGTWAMSSGGVWNPVGDPKLNGQGEWVQIEEYGMPAGAGVLRVNHDGTWLWRFAGKTERGRWVDAPDTVHFFNLNGSPERWAYWNWKGWMKLQNKQGVVLEGVKL